MSAVAPPLEPSPAAMMTIMVRIDAITVRHNPRSEIDPQRIAELAGSLKRNGLIEPIVVRRLLTDGKADRFELIAGQRRLLAAKVIGWAEIAAVERKCTDEAAEEITLAENVQRDQLSLWDLFLEVRRLHHLRPAEDALQLVARMGIDYWVVDASLLVDGRCAPDLIERLRYDCRPQILLRLARLARIDAPTEIERHEKQRLTWAADDETERTRRPRARGVVARAPRHMVETAADAIVTRRAIRSPDGTMVPLSAEQATCVATALRWSIDQGSHGQPF